MKGHGGVRVRAFITLVFLSLVAVAALALAACGGSGTTASSSPSATTVAATPITTPAAHEIQVFKDIRFMAARKADRSPFLDVYAPKQAGPGQVLLPGGFERKDTYMRDWANQVAQRGAVVFDGDYLLAQQDPWDNVLQEDPGIMQVYTPWQYLGRRVDFPVTVIGSGDPNLSRKLGDPWSKDSWFVVRDPSGDLRRGLAGLGGLKGDYILNEDLLKLFVQRLKAAGDTVTYVRLTDSSHAVLGPNGMESLLDALVPSTQP